MAFSKFLFPFIRTLQILTLIPIWGILAWFVHQYDKSHQSTPAEILVLFIASLIATFWALISFFQFHHSIGLSVIVALIDMLVLGALIAGVVLLRGIHNQDCASISVPFGVTYGNNSYSMNNGNGWGISVRKSCMMLKSAWALGIVNCGLFFISSLLALMIYRRNERVAVRDKGYVVDDRRPARRRGWY